MNDPNNLNNDNPDSSNSTLSSASEIKMPVERGPERKRIKDKHDLQFVGDIPLEVTVELGRIPITIRGLLSLKKGAVIELDKLAGEPLEILINEKLVCRGEVIVINEKYGIRMTDIIKPSADFDYEMQSTTNTF